MPESDSDDSLSSLSEGTKAECISARAVHHWGQIVLHLKNVHRWGHIVLRRLKPDPLWISWWNWRRSLADEETREPEKGPGSPGSE